MNRIEQPKAERSSWSCGSRQKNEKRTESRPASDPKPDSDSDSHLEGRLRVGRQGRSSVSVAEKSIDVVLGKVRDGDRRRGSRQSLRNSLLVYLIGLRVRSIPRPHGTASRCPIPSFRVNRFSRPLCRPNPRRSFL